MIKKLLFSVAGVIAVAGAGVWANNTSVFVAPDPDVQPKVLSHRGVHQTYHRQGLKSKTCTATRIDEPSHAYLENTIPSMRAAFDAGADVIELDVYLTADKRWAVFHDWTIDCRTDGKGKIRSKTIADLKQLDIGYGYTADGGQTFPFRGKGLGLMPELYEVFDAFPDKQFLVNFKSNDPEEGRKFANDAANNAMWHSSVWAVYGSPKSVTAALAADGALKGFSKPVLFDCLKNYAIWGWSGHVPKACNHTVLAVPSNIAPWLWGWPHKFTNRMKRAGTEVILLGPYKKGDPGTVGIDDAQMLESVPENFDGYVWTNKVQEIAPMLQSREN